MKENLKTTKYNDGSEIQNIKDNIIWGGLTTGAYCWYDNDSIYNKNTYGALYNYYAVGTGKSCPRGWHVPTYQEWQILINYFGGEYLAGGPLKETGPEYHGEVIILEQQMKAGLQPSLEDHEYIVNYPFYGIGEFGEWWASTFNNTIIIRFDATSATIASFANLEYGFSVRCIKD